MKIIFLYFLSLGLCLAAPEKKPNILLILTDDQSWPTLGSYGSDKVPTPHLDRLAAEGIRFTGAYVMPQCTPNGELGHYVSLKPEAGPEFGFDFVAPEGEGSHNAGDKWVDHLTDEAIGFIRKNREDPWFFYLSHHTIHNAVSASDKLVEKHLATGVPATGMFNTTYLAAIEHDMDSPILRQSLPVEEKANLTHAFTGEGIGFIRYHQ